MTLLIDADDTLWENIVVFHRINAAYASWIAPGRDAGEVRSELDELQIALVAEHGYGRETFEKSLLRGITHFADRVPTAADHSRVTDLVRPLLWETLDLIDGVEDTLASLAKRHELLLVTKGNRREQSEKVERSGLRDFFSAVEILPDKTVAEYRRIVRDHSLDPADSWMVGNSPRSDIRPALEAGIGAVFIPHAETWSHELDSVPDHPRLTRLPDFRSLGSMFG